jgi:hypothetical protein
MAAGGVSRFFIAASSTIFCAECQRNAYKRLTTVRGLCRVGTFGYGLC